MPQLNANDSVATLVKWLVEEGASVTKGDVICSIETSKAIVDLESDFSGKLVQLAAPKEEIPVSKPIALIGNNFEQLKKEKEKQVQLNHQDSDKKTVKEKFNATKKARNLAEKLGIDLSLLNIEGIIKEKDVLEFSGKEQLEGQDHIENNDVEIESYVDLTGGRKTGKVLMLESIRTIPQSYVERIVLLDEIVKTITNYEAKKGKLITFLSVVISVLAKTLEQNKRFNAYRENDQILIYKNINIGVVVNQDNYVSIPTIKNACYLPPTEITEELMRIRMSIMRKNPILEDLSGASFMVSAMDHTEITRFIPIVHPRQAATLAIPKIQFKLEDREGVLSKVSYLNLGLSFDHSFLDAIQASKVLNDFADNLNHQKDLLDSEE